jgi:hypothetical protein
MQFGGSFQSNHEEYCDCAEISDEDEEEEWGPTSKQHQNLDIEKCERNLLVPVLPQVVFCFSICDCGTWMQFGTPVLDACSHSSAAKFLGSTSGRIFFFLTSGWNGS